MKMFNGLKIPKEKIEKKMWDHLEKGGMAKNGRFRMKACGDHAVVMRVGKVKRCN